MKFKFFANILTINKLKKILPAILLVSGFQAHAAVITIGNLSYDGSLITGDGRTYLGFDTLKDNTYAETVAYTAPGGAYSGYRIADTADADIFIGSLFGNDADACSVVNGIDDGRTVCGTMDWIDGEFGDTHGNQVDLFFFLSSESGSAREVGFVLMNQKLEEIRQNESWNTIGVSDRFSRGFENADVPISWLLVANDVTAQVPTPPSLAIFGLGLAGIGFARRRRS
jgi:hypothetical protein